MPWIVAVASDRAWSTTLLQLIDGQCLMVDEPCEDVLDIVRRVLVTMH